MAGAAVITAGALPIVQSNHAEAKYKEGITELNKALSKSAQNVSISVENFESGLLQSKATSRIDIKNTSGEKYCLNILTEINFGPKAYIEKKLMTSNSYLVTNSPKGSCKWLSSIIKEHQLGSYLKDIFEGPGPLRLSVSQGILGDYEAHLAGKPISIAGSPIKNEKFRLEFSPINLDMNFTADFKEVVSNFNWQGFSLNTEKKGSKVNVSSGNISYTADQSKLTENIYTGPVKLSWQGLNIHISEPNKLIEFNDISLNSIDVSADIQEHRGTLNESMELSIDGIKVNKKELGKVKLGVALNNLSTQKLDKLLEEFSKIGHLSKSQEGATLALAKKMPHYLDLMKQTFSQTNTSITSLNYTSPDYGSIEIKSNLQLKDLTKLDPSLVTNPGYVRKFLNLSMSASADPTMLEEIINRSKSAAQPKNKGIRSFKPSKQQTTNLIASLEQQGLLKKEQAKYHVAAEFNANGLLVNGTHINL